MNSMNFSIHGICGIKIEEPPEHIRAFLAREFRQYKTNEDVSAKSPCMVISFSARRIPVPEEHVIFSKECIYGDGKLYIKRGSSAMSVPIGDITKDKMAVLAENGMDGWGVFYLIEKFLQIKAMEKDHYFLHAGGFSEGGNATIYAASQGIGKTLLVLKEVMAGKALLGDELIIINRRMETLPYTRGINFHIFQKEIYPIALGKISTARRIKIFIIKHLLSSLEAALSIFPGWKGRIENYIKWRSKIRLNIKEVMPDAGISASAKAGKFYILMKSPSCGNEKRFSIHDTQAARLLLRDIRNERALFVKDIFYPFLAYGDPVSGTVRKYLARLYIKEALFFRYMTKTLRPSILWAQ